MFSARALLARKRLSAEKWTSPRPGGFTLVEMLVTITIIGMLAAISMGGLSYARQAACEAATKATIAKLHNIVMEKYESYQTRRVPVSTSGLNPQAAAAVRLAAIRGLMVMEMPERWGDVDPDLNDPNNPQPQPMALPQAKQLVRSSLALKYLQQFRSARNAFGMSNVGLHGYAKCLYMIVAADPENLEQFSRSEIDIPDGDGLPVFIDGWGKPIYFLRWAPAFSYSSAYYYPTPAPIQAGYNGSSDLQSGNAQNDHDPFDLRKVDSSAYGLIPLIYSAGPDKEYGLNVEEGEGSDFLYYFENNRVGTLPNYENIYWRIYDTTRFENNLKEYRRNGAPVDKNNNIIANGAGYLHLDNIHNHHIESR